MEKSIMQLHRDLKMANARIRRENEKGGLANNEYIYQLMDARDEIQKQIDEYETGGVTEVKSHATWLHAGVFFGAVGMAIAVVGYFI